MASHGGARPGSGAGAGSVVRSGVGGSRASVRSTRKVTNWREFAGARRSPSSLRHLALDLLGRHIRGRAERAAAVSGGASDTPAVGLGDPEIEHLHGPRLGAEDVLRFDVAMHDAQALGRGQTTRGLIGDPERLLDGELAARLMEMLAQRLAAEQLHGDPDPAVFVARVVESDDVLMVELGQEAALQREALLELFGLATPGLKHLDRREVVRDLIDADVHLREAAEIEGIGEPVRTAAIPGLERIALAHGVALCP
jgi:hypothetical protein